MLFQFYTYLWDELIFFTIRTIILGITRAFELGKKCDFILGSYVQDKKCVDDLQYTQVKCTK